MKINKEDALVCSKWSKWVLVIVGLMCQTVFWYWLNCVILEKGAVNRSLLEPKFTNATVSTETCGMQQNYVSQWP